MAIKEKTGIMPKVYMTKYWQPYYGGGKEQVKYDRLYNRIFDNKEIGKFIDVDGFSDIKDSLITCLDNFLDAPQFLYNDWRSEAMKDRLVGEMANMSEIKTCEQKLRYYLIRSGILK